MSGNRFVYDLAANSKPQIVYDPQNSRRAMLEGRLAGQSSLDVFPIGALLLAGGVAFTIWLFKLKRDVREEAPDLIDALAAARKPRR